MEPTLLYNLRLSVAHELQDTFEETEDPPDYYHNHV